MRISHHGAGRATMALLLLLTAGRAAAQEPVVQSETQRIEAQTALERARADRDRAAAERITALGLPSFEGKTTLGDNAGAIEATMLTSHAVRAAAAMIASDVSTSGAKASDGRLRPVIVLAGDEAIDFSRIGALEAEMDAIRNVLLPYDDLNGAESVLSAPAVIAAATAAAGLFRSDTDVGALDLQALSTRVLASMVAGDLGADAIVPSAAIGALAPEPAARDWREMSLMQRLNALIELRRRAAGGKPKPADADKPTEDEKKALARHASALARFDAFLTRVTTADEKGALPIVQTARLAQFWRQQPQILRVYVDKAGGSRITSKNLWTTLGLADPVRISGGLVTSYSLTDPNSGRQLAFDLLSCRTTVTRLRSVQRGVWTNQAENPSQTAECEGRSGLYATGRRDRTTGR